MKTSTQTPHRKSIFAILLLLLIHTSALASPSRALLVAMAGRDSCQGVGPHQTTFARRVSSLKAPLSDKGYTEIDSLYVCFDRYDYQQGGINYLSSRKPQLIWTGYLPHVQQELQTLLEDSPDTDVFIIGYSYGGWLALRSVQRMVKLPTHHVFLFSIDPISAKHCGPAEVIFGSSGCLEAPRDLNYRTIAKKVDHWTNFYQTRSDFIHSAPITYAKNKQLHTGHTEIDDSSAVWSEIKKAMFGFLQTRRDRLKH